MNAFEKFKKIEIKHSTEKITALNCKVWLFLRVYAFDVYLKRESSEVGINIKSIVQVFKNLFWAFPFRLKFDTVIFSSTDQRKEIDGKWYDRMDFDDYLCNNALFVELPAPSHIKRHMLPSRYLLSKGWLYLVEFITTHFIAPPKLKNDEVFSAVLRDLDISIDKNRLLKKFYTQYLVSRFFFKILGVKQLFTTTYYTNTGRILAAKSLGINVIELQHGLITPFHIGYNIPPYNDPRLIPDFIFVFGEFDKYTLENIGFLPSERIKVIGSHYIDYLSKKQSFRVVKNLEKVCFTAQDVEIEETVMWLNYFSETHPTCECIFKPRKRPISVYRQAGLSTKWKLSNDDTYTLLSKSDIHFTLYSTCANESIALGTPSVLLNIGKHAQTHFKMEIAELSSLSIFDSMTDLKNIEERVMFRDREKVFQEGGKLYRPGYLNNLKVVLREVSQHD